MVYYYKPFGYLVTAIYQGGQLLQIDTTGAYRLIHGGLLNDSIRKKIRCVRYTYIGPVQRPHQIDINSISSSASYSGWTSNVPSVGITSTSTSAAVYDDIYSDLEEGEIRESDDDKLSLPVFPQQQQQQQQLNSTAISNKRARDLKDDSAVKRLKSADQPQIDSSTAATTTVVSSPAKSALKSGKRSTTTKKKKNKKTTIPAAPIPVRRFSLPKKSRSRSSKRASSSATSAVAGRSVPSTTELHRMLDELRKNVTRSGWRFGRYRKKRWRSPSIPLLPACRYLRFTGKVDVAGSGNMHVVDNNHLNICHINLRMLNGLMFLQHLPALLNVYFAVCFTELTEAVFKKMEIICARMNYKALRRGYVGIVVNLASVASVVDVDLDRASSLYSSDFNSRFALYELILVSGIKVHAAVCYFHSGWQARSSIRCQFGQYIEKSIKSIGELHYFRAFLGDVNSVGHWQDRSRYLRLVTTPLQLRSSLWYRHLLAEYKRECNHHLEAVLMPLARVGFIDSIHLSRCQNTPARSTNIHLRLSHFRDLSPVSALDVVMLPPHLLSNCSLQYGINGGLHSFLDHTVVGVTLPLQQPSTGDEIVASGCIPSFYSQQPPVPDIHIPINAPAKYHSVTTTFKFKVGSNISNISMEAIVSRTSTPHKHPSQKEANALFLKGLTLLSNGRFLSSYIPQRQQQKQQQQNAPLKTAQSEQQQKQTSTLTDEQRQQNITKCNRYQNNLKVLYNKLHELVDEAQLITQLDPIREALQIKSSTTSTSNSAFIRKISAIAKRLRDVIPNSQTFTNPQLLQEASDIIKLIQNNTNLTIAEAVAELDIVPTEEGRWKSNSRSGKLHPRLRRCLNKWLDDNKSNPYPTGAEIAKWAKIAGVGVKIIGTWFERARWRIKLKAQNATRTTNKV
ncbi:hypothetical protein GQ42DRAFT_164359 [Ramicandelaber brevisporus]|nr:hypothetical protein GQ42DRAFT_164359 [Ramicandelaber brevisporus]